MQIVLNDKLNTIKFLKMKNIVINKNCYLCNKSLENVAHLYFDCYNTKQVLRCIFYFYFYFFNHFDCDFY